MYFFSSNIISRLIMTVICPNLMHLYLLSDIINQTIYQSEQFQYFLIFCFSSLPSISSSEKRHTARWIDWSHSLPTSLRRDPECKHANQVRGHFTFRDHAKEWRGLRHRSSNANRMFSPSDDFVGVDQMDSMMRSVKKRDKNRFVRAYDAGALYYNSPVISKHVSWHEVCEWVCRGLTGCRALVIRLVCEEHVGRQDHFAFLRHFYRPFLFIFFPFCFKEKKFVFHL